MAGETAQVTDRLKVLVLADSRSAHTERYVVQLRRQNCRVLAASLEKGTLHHYHLKRCGPVRWLHYSLAAMEIRTLVRRFKPDIVNPHFASGYGFAVALAGIRKVSPVLLHLWGSDILQVPQKSVFHRLKTWIALQVSDGVIGDSEFLLQQAEKIGAIRSKRTIVWGIEEEHLSLHRKDYRPGHPLRVIVPRPHEKVYNNIFVLQSLAPLIQDGKVAVTFPDFGSLASEFRHEAKPLAGDSLKFYSRLARREFLALMADHDLYLSASLSDSSPASLIEAMGLGLVPVVADIPGVREWLHPPDGYLFDLSDKNSLYTVVSELAEKNDAHEQMRKRNLQKVHDRAVFEDNVAETIDYMNTLIKMRRS